MNGWIRSPSAGIALSACPSAVRHAVSSPEVRAPAGIGQPGEHPIAVRRPDRRRHRVDERARVGVGGGRDQGGHRPGPRGSRTASSRPGRRLKSSTAAARSPSWSAVSGAGNRSIALTEDVQVDDAVSVTSSEATGLGPHRRRWPKLPSPRCTGARSCRDRRRRRPAHLVAGEGLRPPGHCGPAPDPGARSPASAPSGSLDPLNRVRACSALLDRDVDSARPQGGRAQRHTPSCPDPSRRPVPGRREGFEPPVPPPRRNGPRRCGRTPAGPATRLCRRCHRALRTSGDRLAQPLLGLHETTLDVADPSQVLTSPRPAPGVPSGVVGLVGGAYQRLGR